MVSSLINMNIRVDTNKKPVMYNGRFTVEQYVSTFLNGLGETQRNRFKKMIELGIKSGMSVAKSYGLDYDEFITEVKKQLKIK